MTDLSPAAQVMIAVTHAYKEHGGEPPACAVAAAALRAAADLINGVPDDWGLMSNAFRAGRASAATKLLAIAAELGGAHALPTPDATND